MYQTICTIMYVNRLSGCCSKQLALCAKTGGFGSIPFKTSFAPSFASVLRFAV